MGVGFGGDTVAGVVLSSVLGAHDSPQGFIASMRMIASGCLDHH